jgi:hypothetical protein
MRFSLGRIFPKTIFGGEEMDLLRLLQIDSSLIGPEARESLLLADRIWREAGAPREMWALVAALEEILRRCKESGIWYAPILLQRKKALERGTWRVPRAARISFGFLACCIACCIACQVERHRVLR